ncbi:hypothetical protein BDZ45DRAFT_672638 [Acephala macrosclerotiorum]|nr:hypothetical protein BDZ45DRAFT_672638 [Acephala macrosclerotiorum]
MAPTTVNFLVLKRDCKYSDGYLCYSIPQGAIAGIVIGSAALLIALAAVIFICMKRRRRAKKRKLGEEQAQGDTMQYMGSAKHEPIAFNPHAY